MFIDVVLPLALPNMLTYEVPSELQDEIDFGKRVEVPLKNHRVSALVAKLNTSPETLHKPKKVISVIDKFPIINESQLKLWQWIAYYYACTLGEVMSVALPGGLKLVSETKIVNNENVDPYQMDLTDEEFIIAEAVSIQNELRISDIQDILDKKSILPIVKSLFEKGVIVIKEELVEKFKPKKQYHIRFPDIYIENPELVSELFEKVGNSELQNRTLLAYIQKSKGKNWVLQKEVTDKADTNSTVVKAMVKKEIFIQQKKEISRIDTIETSEEITDLTPLQSQKYNEILDLFENHDAVVIDGITGSGKTRIYIELIKKVMESDKQTLYLLPEIALTTQLVDRLQKVFGKDVLVYHSKINNQERVELYHAAAQAKIIMGPRSAMFLPFEKLGLIIVDEEHDPSYKQQHPAPRYNARDTSMIVAKIHNCKTILGSATPSLDTWVNTKQHKFGLVQIKERYGNAQLPEIELVNLQEKYKKNQMTSYFSDTLLDEIKNDLVMQRQVILFQNRRGYAPIIQCNSCGWVAECRNCDTSLTYHKYFDEVRCHYCGFRQKKPKSCPSCGHEYLDDSGFGTERVESELKKILPEAKIKRLDYDTANTKTNFEKILYQFGNREIDILIGTQMVTKGLDFENVHLVGILNADKLMHFPDFRAHERAIQLMIQVSGRAGRRGVKGKVIIQSFNPSLPIFADVVNNELEHFYYEELKERKTHQFPPFVRMILIECKHKKLDKLKDASRELHFELKKKLGNRISEVFEPSIARVRGYYIRHMIVKIEKNNQTLKFCKNWILHYRQKIKSVKGYGSLRINIDVDPY